MTIEDVKVLVRKNFRNCRVLKCFEGEKRYLVCLVGDNDSPIELPNGKKYWMLIDNQYYLDKETQRFSPAGSIERSGSELEEIDAMTEIYNDE